jgi:dihydrofolate reductase
MRKLIASEFLTLDGVMEDPHKWMNGIHFTFWNDEQMKYASDLLFESDALLLGRVTYEGFAAAWPGRGGQGDAYADRVNSIPKYIASKTLKTLEWENSHLLEGDVVDAVAKLKQEPSENILLFGSPTLLRTLARHGLVDEYRLWIDPIVVGKGRRLFEDGVDPAVLKLADVTDFGSGVIALCYTPVREDASG